METVKEIQVEYWKMGASSLAQEIANGRATSREIVDCFIKRIEAKNKEYKAIIIPMFEEALKDADQADEAIKQGIHTGPLHGVPITIKESIAVKGTPSTWGLPERAGDLSKHDDPAVQKLREAGAIIIGKTNIMQLLMGCESNNPLYGRSLNPWDPARTPGGSSGGEGAAIAYGGSPLGLGSDIGGSIRTPALFCGIHGLKPTAGRITSSPPIGITHIKPECAAMSSLGPLAREVDDLILAFKIMADKQDSYPFEPHKVKVQNLKIGFFIEDGIVSPSAPLKRILKEAAGTLSDYGTETVEFKVPNLKELIKDFYQIMCTDGGNGLREAIGSQEQVLQIQNVLRSQSMPKLQRFFLSGLMRLLSQKTVGEVLLPNTGKISDYQYEKLILKRNLVRESFQKRMDREQIDILICPPFICPALQHDLSVQLSYEGAYGPMFNYLNMPAGVVSLGRVKASDITKRTESKERVIQTLQKIEEESIGLPIGIQVAGKPFCEDKVLAVMKVLEERFKKLGDYPAGKLCT